MNQLSRGPVWAVSCVLACLCGSGAALAATPECDQAWASYNEFKQRNTMEESQYALTVQGAAVRQACGQDALPAPPGSDTPLMPIIREPKSTTPIAPPAPTHPIVLPPQPAHPIVLPPQPAHPIAPPQPDSPAAPARSPIGPRAN